MSSSVSSLPDALRSSHLFEAQLYLFLCGWAGSLWLCGLFSGCGESRGHSSAVGHGCLTEGASLVAERGLQACGLQQPQLLAPRAQAQWPWCTRLAAPPYVRSCWTRGWTHVSCTGRGILHHWDTREAPLSFSILFYFFYDVCLPIRDMTVPLFSLL